MTEDMLLERQAALAALGGRLPSLLASAAWPVLSTHMLFTTHTQHMYSARSLALCKQESGYEGCTPAPLPGPFITCVLMHSFCCWSAELACMRAWPCRGGAQHPVARCPSAAWHSTCLPISQVVAIWDAEPHHRV